MSSPVPPSDPYYTLNRFYRERFGALTYKVGVRAGFTCPNRDGAKGRGGCGFCSDLNLVPRSFRTGMGVAEQVRRGIEHLRKKYNAARFIVYFQDHTATYAPASGLEKLFAEALDHPLVAGLAVGTRPDCLEQPVLDLLGRLAKEKFVQLELGLQSASDQTLARVNRGHTAADFVRAHDAVSALGLHVVTHVIVGFPWETREDHLRTVGLLNSVGAHGVKFHALHIVRGSEFERAFRDRPFNLMDLDSYAARMVELLERLRPDTVVHRVTGETTPDLLVAPAWVLEKSRVVEEIRTRMKKSGTWQGIFYVPASGAGGGKRGG